MLYLIWALALCCIGLGLVGTVFPALPGTPLIFIGALLIGWWQDFAIIGAPSLIVLGVLAVSSIVIDFVASSLGAKRVGASTWAIVGATIGSIIGIFFSIPGIIIGPFLGAFAGELLAQSSVHQAAKVGIGTWVGLLLGTAAKVAVAFSMIGVFILALLV